MKKILFVAALVVALCLSTVAANGGVDNEWLDTDVMTITGTTGSVELILQPVTLHFDYLQPGETLAVSWWIKNTGKCPLHVEVMVVPNVTYVNPVFYPGYSFDIGPNILKNVALTVKMNSWVHPSRQNKDFEVVVTFNSKEAGNRQETPVYDTW